MSTRIPPSLTWLIDKRARLAGELLKARKAQDKINRLIQCISTIQMDLDAIDRTLALHEIQVEPENIRPILSAVRNNRFPRGELTRSLLLRLRLANGEPLTTDALTFYIADRFSFAQDDILVMWELREAVRYRLKNLANANIISRSPPPVGNRSLWILTTLITENHS